MCVGGGGGERGWSVKWRAGGGVELRRGVLVGSCGAKTGVLGGLLATLLIGHWKQSENRGHFIWSKSCHWQRV